MQLFNFENAHTETNTRKQNNMMPIPRGTPTLAHSLLFLIGLQAEIMFGMLLGISIPPDIVRASIAEFIWVGVVDDQDPVATNLAFLEYRGYRTYQWRKNLRKEVDPVDYTGLVKSRLALLC